MVRSGPSGTDVTLASNAGAIAGAKARKVPCAPMYLGEAAPMRITFPQLESKHGNNEHPSLAVYGAALIRWLVAFSSSAPEKT